MSENIILKLVDDYYPEKENTLYESLFQQYNKIIIESLITSFGLEAIFTKAGIIVDRHGGDVDTIHNVRKIGEDKEITYKNKENEQAYLKKEEYNFSSYHSDENFKTKKSEARKKWQETGKSIRDEYTDGNIGFYGHTNAIFPDKKAELDHIMECKGIHEDRGRILAGISGKDLANSNENLAWTNKSLNASMGAWAKGVNEKYKKEHGCDAPLEKVDMKAYIEAHPELDETTKKNMLFQYEKAKKAYDSKINKAYYTSSKFRKDVFDSSVKVGFQMGLRQALGFIITEVVFATMEELENIKDNDNLEKIFLTVSNGVKKGFERAKNKYKDIITKFKDGVIAGILSSLTTTLINIFSTTSKNIVKILRQVWVSLIEAMKILFLNPDNLLFGERMRAGAKIISTGASIAIGIITKEFISKMGIATIPVVGETLVNFIELLTVGITSCTFLYFLDRNQVINKLVLSLDKIPTMSNIVNYYKEQAEYFEKYASKILEIDVDSFEKEIDKFNITYSKLEKAKDENEINIILKDFFKDMKFNLPWEGDFNAFMENKDSTLIFK